MEIDIKHIAKLARLSIPEEKVAKFQHEMEGIIEMVENLPELPAGGALVDESNTMELRKDEVVPSYSREEILRNAPNTAAGCILIPRVVD
ncbi:MAG: Asp-tRNA(Asn)/Glu-tRNA(Gln) amidotransferase subunit GatC [Oscillospiraceae bacterium]